MTTYHEPMYLSDVLLIEVARGWTTQNVKVKTDVALAIGTVLYRGAEQDYFDPVADSMGYVNVAVLADNLKASDEVQTALAIVRGAVVATENLTFYGNVSDEDKKGAIATLNSVGIMTQGEVLPVTNESQSVSESSTLQPDGVSSSNVVTGEGSGAIGD